MNTMKMRAIREGYIVIIQEHQSFHDRFYSDVIILSPDSRGEDEVEIQKPLVYIPENASR